MTEISTVKTEPIWEDEEEYTTPDEKITKSDEIKDDTKCVSPSAGALLDTFDFKSLKVEENAEQAKQSNSSSSKRTQSKEGFVIPCSPSVLRSSPALTLSTSRRKKEHDDITQFLRETSKTFHTMRHPAPKSADEAFVNYVAEEFRRIKSARTRRVLTSKISNLIHEEIVKESGN